MSGAVVGDVNDSCTLANSQDQYYSHQAPPVAFLRLISSFEQTGRPSTEHLTSAVPKAQATRAEVSLNTSQETPENARVWHSVAFRGGIRRLQAVTRSPIWPSEPRLGKSRSGSTHRHFMFGSLWSFRPMS